MHHHLGEVRSADLGMVEVFVPELEVFDGSVQAGGAGRVEVGEVHAEGLAGAVLLIAQGVVLDDFLVVVAEVGVSHPKRREDVLGGEFAEAHAADAADDDGEQGEAGVGVEEFFAGLVVEVLLGA